MNQPKRSKWSHMFLRELCHHPGTFIIKNMKTSSPYVDELAFKNLKEIQDLKSKIDALGELAGKGEVHAAASYGEILLTGVWDEKRLYIDSVRGTLLPAQKDPKTIDSYLILPRDPLRGVAYLTLAADFKQKGKVIAAVIRARSVLRYLQRKGLAGLPAGRITYKESAIDLPAYEAEKFDEAAKVATVAELENGSPQQPDTRPQVQDLNTKHFAHLAAVGKDHINLQFYFCLISTVILCIWLFTSRNDFGYVKLLKLLGFTIVFYLVPLKLFDYLIDLYGSKKRMPFCSCKKIREAHQMALNKLPVDCRMKMNPFNSAPFFIRNLLHIKEFYFWSHVMIISIFTGLWINNVEIIKTIWIHLANFFEFGVNSNFRKIMPVFICSVSSFILMNDKNATKWMDLLAIFMSPIFFLFDDQCCSDEVKLLSDDPEVLTKMLDD